MQRQPTVVGLKLCQQAVVQERTRNVTLVNCFRKLVFRSFPAEPLPFTVCIVLTDGLGKGELTLTITSLEGMQDVWEHSWEADFPDPLKELWFLIPVAGCTFPEPGRYQAALSVNGEATAQAILRVEEV